MTKAVVLDDISKFRPKWNQTRALDYFYYSGIANAKVHANELPRSFLTLTEYQLLFNQNFKPSFNILGSWTYEGNL